MIKKLFQISIIVSLFSSCSVANLNKDSFLKTTSSAVGGYLGYEFSDGDILSTSVGSAVGVVLGGYLVDFINQNDYYYYRTEAMKVLEINDSNKSVRTGYWKNPKSGNEGVVKIKGHYTTPECRLIEHNFLIKDRPKRVLDTACREKSGQWAMVK